MKRMGNTKKIAALLTAGAMVMATAVPALAASATGTASDTGSITVNGLEEGVTVSAYQIAYADYDSDSGRFVGYKMVTDSGWTIASDGSYTTEPTESDLEDLWGQVKNGSPTGSAKASSGGTAVISGLPVGSYLLVVSGSESTVYSLMIGSVSYTASNGEWQTADGEFDVTSSTVWVKSAKPDVVKEEVDSSGKTTHGDSASIGDEVTFHITVDNIPHYDGEYPEFEVLDTMTGLEITAEELGQITVTVSDGTVLTAGKDYIVTTTSDGFMVDFVVNGSYTLNAYAGKSLVIEYKATVTSTAANEEGVADHNNAASLVFSTNSFLSGSEGTDDEGGDVSHEYTFNVSLKKVGTDAGDTNGLPGAEFTLYDSTGAKAGTATSGNDGTFGFSDLKEGSYTLKETKAPDGYVLLTTVYTLKIEAQYSADGSILTWSVTVTDDAGNSVGQATGTGTTDATIENTHIASGTLPSMGGRGTLLLILAGCAVVACAAVGAAVVRRKEAA